MGRSTLRDPVCCIFFFSMLFLKESVFLTSSWKIGTSRAARSSQDWDHEKGHLLGFLSVTPFSDLLLKGNLFSYAPLPQDMECFLALWRLLLAWLCFSSIILLPKAALYEDIETYVSANKAPLFHSRPGFPASFFSLTPVPRSQSTKTVTSGAWTGSWWMP